MTSPQTMTLMDRVKAGSTALMLGTATLTVGAAALTMMAPTSAEAQSRGAGGLGETSPGTGTDNDRGGGSGVGECSSCDTPDPETPTREGGDRPVVRNQDHCGYRVLETYLREVWLDHARSMPVLQEMSRPGIIGEVYDMLPVDGSTRQARLKNCPLVHQPANTNIGTPTTTGTPTHTVITPRPVVSDEPLVIDYSVGTIAWPEACEGAETFRKALQNGVGPIIDRSLRAGEAYDDFTAEEVELMNSCDGFGVITQSQDRPTPAGDTCLFVKDSYDDFASLFNAAKGYVDEGICPVQETSAPDPVTTPEPEAVTGPEPRANGACNAVFALSAGLTHLGQTLNQVWTNEDGTKHVSTVNSPDDVIGVQCGENTYYMTEDLDQNMDRIMTKDANGEYTYFTTQAPVSEVEDGCCENACGAQANGALTPAPRP